MNCFLAFFLDSIFNDIEPSMPKQFMLLPPVELVSVMSCFRDFLFYVSIDVSQYRKDKVDVGNIVFESYPTLYISYSNLGHDFCVLELMKLFILQQVGHPCTEIGEFSVKPLVSCRILDFPEFFLSFVDIQVFPIECL